MKRRIGRTKTSVVAELIVGGNAFEDQSGNPLTSQIKRSEVGPTLDSLLNDVLKPIGIDSFFPLGSTGKKDISGDIDIAIGPVPTSDVKALKILKDSILMGIQRIVGQDKAKLVGQNIGIMYPISGNPESYVQVDVMLSGDPSKTGWLMSGTGSGVKGVYRNLMLSYLAKLRSEERPGTKITLSFPGGVQVMQDNEIVTPRTEDTEAIVSALGISAKPSEITTFEDLVSILSGDSSVSSKLSGFETYISRYLQSPDTSVEAMKAMGALKNALNLRETVRLILRLV